MCIHKPQRGKTRFRQRGTPTQRPNDRAIRSPYSWVEIVHRSSMNSSFACREAKDDIFPVKALMSSSLRVKDVNAVCPMASMNKAESNSFGISKARWQHNLSTTSITQQLLSMRHGEAEAILYSLHKTSYCVTTSLWNYARLSLYPLFF